MNIRPFRESDTAGLIQLFQKTVHTVCAVDYTLEQLLAWAPAEISEAKWSARFSQTFTFVAEDSGHLAGFANIEANGYIDMFYTAANWQNKGVGTILLARIEIQAMQLGLKRMYSDVSLTARRFFLARGFVIEKEYEKLVGGIAFQNAIMTKSL